MLAVDFLDIVATRKKNELMLKTAGVERSLLIIIGQAEKGYIFQAFTAKECRLPG